MSLTKRTKGDLLVESVDASDSLTIKSQEIVLCGLDRYTDDPDNDGYINFANTVTIKGNLVVVGETTSVQSINTEITDNEIILNSGETAGVVSSGFAGIAIDRTDGIVSDFSRKLRYTESFGGRWEATDNGTAWYALNQSAGGFALVNDFDPTLGGDLDVSTYAITTSEPNQDITLINTLGGEILLDPYIKLRMLDEVTEIPAIIADTGFNKIYAAEPGGGGAGLYVKNTTVQDELITRRKALLYSIIF